jgi:hypothetical protein
MAPVKLARQLSNEGRLLLAQGLSEEHGSGEDAGDGFEGGGGGRGEW